MLVLSLVKSRTPPGVRELKLTIITILTMEQSRTPPGVRELKQDIVGGYIELVHVAPLPGCVN